MSTGAEELEALAMSEGIARLINMVAQVIRRRLLRGRRAEQWETVAFRLEALSEMARQLRDEREASTRSL
jgi:urease gamma subunit